jgi:hypothetical protein
VGTRMQIKLDVNVRHVSTGSSLEQRCWQDVMDPERKLLRGEKQSKLDQDHVPRRALRHWPGNPCSSGNRLRRSTRFILHGLPFSEGHRTQSAQHGGCRTGLEGHISLPAHPTGHWPRFSRVCKAGGPITHHTCPNSELPEQDGARANVKPQEQPNRPPILEILVCKAPPTPEARRTIVCGVGWLGIGFNTSLSLKRHAHNCGCAAGQVKRRQEHGVLQFVVVSATTRVKANGSATRPLHL